MKPLKGINRIHFAGVMLMGCLLAFDCLALSGLPGWSLVREADGVKLWRNDVQPEVIATMQTVKNAKPLEWTDAGEKEIFQRFEKNKKKVLSLAGVSNWQVQNRQWISNEGHYELSAQGSYTNHSGKETAFKEIHFYHPEKTVHILFAMPASLKAGPEFIKKMEASLRSEAFK